MAIPGFAQTELIQDGIIYKLYTPETGTPYAEVFGNLITEATDVVIPNMVTKDNVDYPVTAIAKTAFYECQYLTGIKIGNSVKTIGEFAFSGCKSLASVEIPNSVTSIGESAFQYCSSLTSIEIPNSVTYIGVYAFAGCSSLTSIEIPNSVTTINGWAFYGCESLESVVIGNSVTSIGVSAFQYCSSLTSIDIPNSVTSIEYGTFRHCSALISVEFPNSVTPIGNYAFYNCDKIETVLYDTTEPINCDKNIFSDAVYQNATLSVAKGGLDKAYETEPWMYFVNIEESNTSGVDDIEVDGNEAVEVYNLNGIKVGESTAGLAKGLYIVKQGSETRKIIVK